MLYTASRSLTLLDTPSLLVQHDQSNGWLHAQWLGYYDADLARTGCTSLLKLARETDCTHLLNDSREVFGDWLPAAEWIGRHFLPDLEHAGIRAVAWVTAMDWPARTSVASTMRHVQAPMVATFEFDAVEEACHWLRNAH